MVARLLLLFVLLLPLPAAAQEVPSPLAGSWALRIDGAVVFRFDLGPQPDRGEWRGTWSRPSSFASDGDNFAELKLPARRIESMAGFEADGGVEISFPDPRPGAIPDIFRFRLIDFDAAEMIYVGTGLAPYVLERVPPGTALGPFREGATYARPLPPESEPDAPPEPRLEPEDVLPPSDDPNDFRLPSSGVEGR